MSFFNSKEEVLDIELTQHGKELLSKGQLDPKYYSFFDEDIIYDSSCFGYEETQNYTQTRILEETPFFKTQATFVSPTRNLNLKQKQANSLGLSLNSADYSETYAPAIQVEVKKGNIQNVNFQSEKWYDRFGSYIVPQINLQQETIEIIADTGYSKKPLLQNENLGLLPKEDDTFVKVILKELVFDIFEENVENLKNNFEIEIYKVNEFLDDIEKLEFPNQKKVTYGGVIIDDILYETAVDSQTSISDIPSNILEQPMFLEEDAILVTSYFNYSVDVFETEEKISNKRLFIYDPELYVPPPCD